MVFARKRIGAWVGYHLRVVVASAILFCVGAFVVAYIAATNGTFRADLAAIGQATYSLTVGALAPLVLFIVAMANVIYLSRYVNKTTDIAESNRRSVVATLRAAQATQDAAEASRQAITEMQATRDAETAPYVVVYVDASDFVVDLVMENLGKTAARDVALSFSPALPTEIFAGDEAPAFVSGATPTLAPRQQVRRVLNSFPGLYSLNAKGVPLRYEVTVSYRGGTVEQVRERERQEVYVIDINSFLGVTLQENKVEKALEKGFGNVVDKLSRANDKLGDLERRLALGLAINTVVSHRLDAQSPEEHVTYFRALVRSIASELRIWRAKQETVHSFSSYLMKDRLNLVAGELMALAPYLPITDEKVDEVRSLAFDLRAGVRWLDFSDNPRNQIEATLSQLVALVEALDQSPQSGGLRQEPSAVRADNPTATHADAEAPLHLPQRNSDQ